LFEVQNLSFSATPGSGSLRAMIIGANTITFKAGLSGTVGVDDFLAFRLRFRATV
jgi:hypothetical protein